MARFRYRTCVLVGPWRRSREQAEQDAVSRGQALRDAPDGELSWRVPGEIEAGDGDGKEGP